MPVDTVSSAGKEMEGAGEEGHATVLSQGKGLRELQKVWAREKGCIFGTMERQGSGGPLIPFTSPFLVLPGALPLLGSSGRHNGNSSFPFL